MGSLADDYLAGVAAGVDVRPAAARGPDVPGARVARTGQRRISPRWASARVRSKTRWPPRAPRSPRSSRAATSTTTQRPTRCGRSLPPRIPGEPLVGEANAILQPAEASGGQRSFRYVAPGALLLVLVFGVMYLRDRAKGGYRAVKLEKLAARCCSCLRTGRSRTGRCGAAGGAMCRVTSHESRVTAAGPQGSGALPRRQRAPSPDATRASRSCRRWRGTASTCSTPTTSRISTTASWIATTRSMLYNNHTTVGPEQLASLLRFVG